MVLVVTRNHLGHEVDPDPPYRQPRGIWMVYLVNSHTNATSKRWHLWEIDLGFSLNSTPGWQIFVSTEL